jgi:hypothetical protein
MRIPNILLGTGLMVLLLAEAGMAGGIRREPLDQLWEDHMLAGTSAIYSDGKRVTYAPDRSYETAGGNPSDAAFTKQGIAIGDFRESRLLLWVGGGWALDGGLLAKAEDQKSAVELYGKQVTRREPSFILNPKAIHVPTETYSYEFSLLLRRDGAPRARILRKWVFPPEDVPLDEEDRLPKGLVTGHLRYDGATKTATVTVKGLKRPIEERVDLTRVLEEPAK